jgi:hypothetical protein
MDSAVSSLSICICNCTPLHPILSVSLPFHDIGQIPPRTHLCTIQVGTLLSESTPRKIHHTRSILQVFQHFFGHALQLVGFLESKLVSDLDTSCSSSVLCKRPDQTPFFSDGDTSCNRLLSPCYYWKLHVLLCYAICCLLVCYSVACRVMTQITFLFFLLLLFFNCQQVIRHPHFHCAVRCTQCECEFG